MGSEGLTEAIPPTLLERLHAGQAHLVAGLGSASLAGLPGWPETLRRIAARIAGASGKRARWVIEELLARGRRSAALSYLRARVPPAVMAAALREAFPRGLAVPGPLATLAALPWRAVLLTGFDDLWDRALAGAPSPYSALEPTRSTVLERGFLHVLGQPDTTGDLCLGPADLRRGERPARLAPLLRQGFREQSLVFLGFEPDDPDLALLVHGFLGAAASGVEHFFLWAGAPAVGAVMDVVAAELAVTVVPAGGDLEELARRLAGAYQRYSEAPRTAEGQGAWPELVDSTLRQLDDSAAPERKGEIFVEVSRILEERLDAQDDGAPLVEDERPETFEALSRLFGALEDWRACVASLDKWAAALGGGAPAAEACVRAGDILVGRLDDESGAEGRYRRALEADPSCGPAVTALAGLALRRGDHGAAVRLYLEAEEGHPARALRACEKAGARLTGVAPLWASADLRRLAGEWGESARLYEEVLRLGGTAVDQGAVELYHHLGLCRAALGDQEAAATWFAKALGRDHVRQSSRVALAESYLARGDHAAWERETRALAVAARGPRSSAEALEAPSSAIALHQQLLAADPDRLSSYRALAQLYADAGAEDELFCVAATLCFLRKAPPDLQAFHRAHRGRAPLTLTVPDPALWRRAAFPGESSSLGRLLSLVAPFVAEAFAQQPEGLGLLPEERADAADERVACRALRRACTALGLTPPVVYFSAAASASASVTVRGLRVDGQVRPALLLGAPVGARTDEEEVAFLVTRAAALLRPEALLRGLVCRVAGNEGASGRRISDGTWHGSAARLGAVVRAALVIGNALPPGRPMSVAAGKVAEALSGRLPAETVARLGVEGRRLVAEQGEAPGVGGWLASVDLTAARLGFSVAGDLAAAARVLAADPPDESPLPAKRRLKDLVAYSVSDEYFAARRALGLLISRSSRS
jgi:tetratricopeptide (TPR) repeat protein